MSNRGSLPCERALVRALKLNALKTEKKSITGSQKMQLLINILRKFRYFKFRENSKKSATKITANILLFESKIQFNPNEKKI